MITNKKILLFGGTGSLGYEIVSRYLHLGNAIYNFSRDECKHWSMKLDFHNHLNLHFIIGDIINYERVTSSIIRVNPDIIIIASAMKHIDQCELNQEACINTNLLGVKNILDTVESHKHNLATQCVLFVSSDKACNPINSYGMCKALSEQLVIEKAYYNPEIKFLNIRYGNVLNSRGSIIPLLHKIGNDPDKTHFTLTHPDMTRFVMTLAQSVDLIEYAILNGESGDTIIPSLISMRVIDLLEIFSAHYGNKPIIQIPVRPGEKMMEALINETQSGRMIAKNGYYHIKSPHVCKDINMDNMREYNSRMNQLSKEQLRDYLIQLKLI